MKQAAKEKERPAENPSRQTPISTSMVSPADLNDLKEGYLEAAVSENELKFNESLRGKHQREASHFVAKDKKINAKAEPDYPDMSPAAIPEKKMRAISA